MPGLGAGKYPPQNPAGWDPSVGNKATIPGGLPAPMQRPDVPPHLCHKLTQTSTEATRYVQLCPVSDRLSDLSALSSALGGTASKPLSSLQPSHRLLITGGTFIPKGGEDVAAQQSWQCPGRDGPVEPLGKEGDG